MMTTASVSRLSVQRLVKSFFGVRVLHEVSFDAHAGRVLGLVGENGSGKSTTMNLICGILPADSGDLFLDGQKFTPASRRDSDAAGIAFIQQELTIFPNLTVAENLFLARPLLKVRGFPLLARRRMHQRALVLLEMVGLDVQPSAAAASLSMGERQLLEIARGLLSEARLLILDEPTSSLTAAEATRLFSIIAKLQRRGVAIIFISHDLNHVLQVCDDILVMRDGRVALQTAAAASSASDLVLAMIGRSLEAQFPSRAMIKQPSGPALLEVTGLSEPKVLRNIHLKVTHGEIVGIAGLMGSGRSELANALFGLERYAAGRVTLEGQTLPSGDVSSRLKAGMSFLTEDRRHEGLLLDATVSDNAALAALPSFASAHLGVVDRPALIEAIRILFYNLDLKSGDIGTTPVRTLSGGNQQKVILARWLLAKPKLFILDEPTRGIDVGAKQDIYRLFAQLAQGGMGILIISSELEELLGLCDRILVMRRGELTATFERAQFDREAIMRAAFGQEAA
jgi:ribose transport system ATP-binding protein